MSKQNSSKVNKSDKIRKDVVAIVLVLLLIGAYVFYECYTATHVEVETITAVNSTVYDAIEAKALVVRDEHIIKTNANGVTVACVDDGEKVKLGGNVAMTFNNEDNAKSYSSLTNLHKELDYYIELESKSAGMATDVATIDKDILSDVNDYIRIINSNSYVPASACANELNDKLARRQMIIGQTIDFSGVKADLEKQINNINVSACQPTGYITSDVSGVFSSYTDGFEDTFNYNKVSELDVSTVKAYMEKASQPAEPAKAFGKLLTSYRWYFCCVLSADDVKGIANGEKLNVSIKDSDKVIECRVESGADLDLGVKETVLVLSCSQVDSQIISMRYEDIEIRFNEYTGFKVPASAIHIDENGNKCVYALVANQVAKRQGKIIYSTKDYVIFESGSNEKNSIRFYDQIITKGKELHDGKVYS